MLPLHKWAPGGLVSPCGHSTRSPAEHTGPWPHSLSRPGDPLGATQMGTTNQCHLPRAKRPPGSSQSQGPREVAPTPAPRASVWNPGGGLRSLPHGLPFVFPSVSCSRLRACCGEKLAQEGVPCARHTQRCMPMNENTGWLWTQGCLEGRKGRQPCEWCTPPTGTHGLGLRLGRPPWKQPWRRQWKSRADAGQGWRGTGGAKAARSAQGPCSPSSTPTNPHPRGSPGTPIPRTLTLQVWDRRHLTRTC